jgi:hypothetical protein
MADFAREMCIELGVGSVDASGRQFTFKSPVRLPMNDDVTREIDCVLHAAFHNRPSTVVIEVRARRERVPADAPLTHR